MADQRDGGIDWTDQTWNPVRGCSRVSPGCENCYAERVAARFSGPGQPYHGLAVIGESGGRWTREVRLVPEHLADPLRWRRPRRIFVNSMSDLFHEKLTNEEIAAVFGVMAAAPRHTFQILTKRPERMKAWFKWVTETADPLQSSWAFADVCQRAAYEALGEDGRLMLHKVKGTFKCWPWPLPNVWLGVTAEDQRRADERIPLLLQTPAAKRFVSVEPQLGPVNLKLRLDESYILDALRGEVWCGPRDDEGSRCARLDWVIQGCESGHGARPFDLAWARSMRDQCKAASVPYFYKQSPRFVTGFTTGRATGPSWLNKAPEIDGRTWKEFP